MTPELLSALGGVISAAISVPIATVLVARITARAQRQTREAVAEVSGKQDDLSNQVRTNHGSTSTGHAIDRITEAVWDIQGRLGRIETTTTQTAQLSAETASTLRTHIVEAVERDSAIAMLKKVVNGGEIGGEDQ